MLKNELESKIKLFGETATELADVLGIATSTLSAKMNGKRDFTQGEIMAIKCHYNLTAEELITIFFN